MRRRMLLVGMLVFASLGLVAPAHATKGLDEEDQLSVSVAGSPPVGVDNDTTTSCDFNAARQVACAVLFALMPIKVDLTTKDGTRVLVSADAHPAPEPTPPPDGPSIVIPLPDPIGPVTIPLPDVGPIPPS